MVIKLFAVLSKSGWAYWQDDIHNWKTWLYRHSINDTIKLLFAYYNKINEPDFYKIHIKAQDEFESIKFIEAYHLYMYKIKNWTYFVLLDNNISQRIIHELLTKVDKLEIKYDKVMTTYKEPEKLDNITIVNQKIDESKKILAKNIELVMDRGEKLDEMIKQTNLLVDDTIGFRRKAEQYNKCCKLL